MPGLSSVSLPQLQGPLAYAEQQSESAEEFQTQFKMFTSLRFESAPCNDAEEIAAVYIDSFAEGAHTACLFTGVDRETRIKDVASRFPAILSEPMTVYLNSLDSHNRIVAHSKWKTPGNVKGDPVREGKVTNPEISSTEASGGGPLGLNDHAAKDFTEKLRTLKSSSISAQRIGRLHFKVKDGL